MLYTFLDGLDNILDKTRSNVLQMNPLSSVEEAYAHVESEDVRQTMMISSAKLSPDALMASKGIKTRHLNS